LSKESSPSGPPRLPFVLSVGVTGHRSDALPDAGEGELRDRVYNALKLILDGALRARDECPGAFSDAPPQLLFVSPIADGADQIAAEAALELGFALSAVLPFARDDYRRDMTTDESRGRYDALLAKSHCVLELPGDRAHEVEGYVMAGRATVAHCDILVAVWDGLVPRGRGGTGEVVQFAISRGTPVVHIPTDPSRRSRVLWAAFDPVVDTLGDDPMAERPLDADHIGRAVQALLLPPADPRERRFLAEFEHERMGRIRKRIEYSLLLAIFGVKKIRFQSFSEAHWVEEIKKEWRQFRADCVERHEISAPLDLLEESYSWSDRLATRFAQTYRSGHIFNFVLGGFAVCMGLSAFMAPAHKFALAMAEFFITLAIIVNTILGTRNEWHRRWLDYRQLAERLRPMRSFKLLGIAAPDPAGTNTNPVPARWIEWYSAAVWRAMGCPSARISPQRADLIAESVADHEVAPQVGYHERHSRTIAKLDNRLDWIGTMLFFATLVVSIATLIGLGIGARFVDILGDWFTLVSAGFPALGTAIFGIRFQGDFGGSSVRSQSTANALKEIEQELRKYTTLTRAADLTEQAARVMLSDLDEWALINQRQELSV
jgi:hypothetical protein